MFPVQAPDADAQEHSGVLGEGAQYFSDDPTVCFLKCRTVAEALNGTAAAAGRLHSVSTTAAEKQTHLKLSWR